MSLRQNVHGLRTVCLEKNEQSGAEVIKFILRKRNLTCTYWKDIVHLFSFIHLFSQGEEAKEDDKDDVDM